MSDQPPAEPKSVRRRWWLAALLQLFGGTGSIYVGRPHRYVVLLLFNLIAIVGFFHGAWGAFANVWVVFFILSIYAVVYLYYLIDAIRLAVRQKSYQLQWYNRWWVYVGCIVLVVLTGNFRTLPEDLHKLAVRSFSIPAASMTPALHVGDYILVDILAYEDHEPSLGDIAVFKLPSDPSVDFVKRVIGLPGDRIKVVDGVVLRNGVELEQTRIEDFEYQDELKVAQFTESMIDQLSYRVLSLNPYSAGDNTSEYTVPAQHYFVLGDNRDNSTDSRFPSVGFIPREHFRGKATGIYWAKDLSRFGNLP